MQAALSLNAEGPEGLRFSEVASPLPGPDEIKVRVRATALNRADLLQTMGLYPAPPGAPGDIPGMEYAGEVAAVGARVRRWSVGDRVMGLVGGGAWAQELVTHEREAMAMPAGMSFADAAALPEAFATAFDALVLQGAMTVNSEVLIHAVASGVGTAALQLCRLFGARAIGTGRNEKKLERARAMGLTRTLLVKDGAFSAQVKQLTAGRGCDIALDLVGGDWFAETIDAMAPQGTVMLVGLVAGPTAEVPLRSVLAKRLRVQGTAMRSRSLEEKIAVARAFEQRLLPSFVSGQLEPVVDAVLPMAELQPALQRLASNDTFGKLVLTW
ncbi:MAG: NAD(P)H-quinone oxidoreductase [Archangium sp.]|nr:NAD(P)H-quinone oxidoreductase [Archangium sp.]MDP3155245.1 NAD(P)H-quinone oxidoreductase [Archangium sp.]MDP3570906.1 NAD(P)H-quinone oxidoreductase [Archangium sp.]